MPRISESVFRTASQVWCISLYVLQTSSHFAGRNSHSIPFTVSWMNFLLKNLWSERQSRSYAGRRGRRQSLSSFRSLRVYVRIRWLHHVRGQFHISVAVISIRNHTWIFKQHFSSYLQVCWRQVRNSELVCKKPATHLFAFQTVKAEPSSMRKYYQWATVSGRSLG